MSTKTWTEDQLLAAYDLGASLVGWAAVDRSGNAPRGITWALDLVATCATGPYDDAMRDACDPYFLTPGAEIEHFCRRVREELGVDEPAWKKLDWEVSDSPGNNVCRADLGVFRLSGWEYPRDRCSYGTLRHVARREDPILSEVREATIDACKAALHDELVKHLLATIRAAVPA